MIFKANSKVDRDLINKIGRSSESNVVLCPELKELLDIGFNRLSNCVVLKKFFDGDSEDGIKESYFDFVQFESFINHIHIEDYVKKSGEYQSQAVCYIGRLITALQSAFPDKSFVVIYTYANDDHIVRFHSCTNDPWLLDDLERYEEAVIQISNA